VPDVGAAAGPFVALLIGVAIFAVVIVVTVVVMSLLQAVLPTTDTGAEAVHRQELADEEREGEP